MSDSEVFLRRSVATDNIAGPDVFGVLNEFRSDVVVVCVESAKSVFS